MASAELHAGSADRLGTTLFVAALAHGIFVLGVTFTGAPGSLPEAAPPLNVTLLLETDTRSIEPNDAELAAQRAQQGAGRGTGDDRPTRAPDAAPGAFEAVDNAGLAADAGAPLDRSDTPPPVTTTQRADTRVDLRPDARDAPTAPPASAAIFVDEGAPRTLAAEVDLTAAMPDSDVPADVARPSTSASVLAAYLVGWRQRVERIGTANFPEGFLARGGEHGRPTLEVAIGPDGSLADIVVRRSSGDRALDEAALEILRMAAPFEPLPENVRAEYDELRFAYEWDFDAGRGRARARRAPEGGE